MIKMIQFYLKLAFTLFAVLCCSSDTVRAADFGPGDRLMALFLEPCPQGWADMYEDFGGRILKAQSREGFKFQRGNAVRTDSPFTHRHSSWTFHATGITAFPETLRPEQAFLNVYNSLTEQNSNMDQHSGNLAYINMRLCRYVDTTKTIQLSTGLIAYFDSPHCPDTRTKRYAPASGRTIIFAGAHKPIGVNNVNSVVGENEDFGLHAHTLEHCTFLTIRSRSVSFPLPVLPSHSLLVWTDNHRFTPNAPTSTDGLNFGYRDAVVCVVQEQHTSSISLPPPSAIFFSDGLQTTGHNGCPRFFQDPDIHKLAGRLIKINGYATDSPVATTGKVYGGEIAKAALGDHSQRFGFGDHNHGIQAHISSFTQARYSVSPCCNLHLVEWRNYYISCYTKGMNLADGKQLVPMTWLRACHAPPTNAPTKSPTKSPTFDPTSSPTKYPTHFPTISPTTSRPTRAPTTGTPSLRPTTSSPTLSPTDHPTTSPTPAPVWVDVCSAEDQELFQNYDNYVIQAASCSDECAIDILTNTLLGRKCVDLCVSVELYTPGCRYCVADFALCQERACRTRCVANRFSAGCAECTNANCREDFAICTGFVGAEVGAGGGDGGDATPPPKQSKRVNYGLITGSVLGAALGMGVAFVAARKYRIHSNVTQDVQDQMESKLFVKTAARGRGDEEQGLALAASNPTFVPLGAPESVALRASQPNTTDKSVAGRMLRSRYSFHGTDQDEIDVAAGAALIAIERNLEWYLVEESRTKRIGLIPASYVLEM